MVGSGQGIGHVQIAVSTFYDDKSVEEIDKCWEELTGIVAVEKEAEKSKTVAKFSLEIENWL